MNPAFIVIVFVSGLLEIIVHIYYIHYYHKLHKTTRITKKIYTIGLCVTIFSIILAIPDYFIEKWMEIDIGGCGIPIAINTSLYIILHCMNLGLLCKKYRSTLNNKQTFGLKQFKIFTLCIMIIYHAIPLGFLALVMIIFFVIGLCLILIPPSPFDKQVLESLKIPNSLKDWLVFFKNGVHKKQMKTAIKKSVDLLQKKKNLNQIVD